MLSPSDNWAFETLNIHLELSRALDKKLDEILRRIDKMATSQAQFDTALASFQAALTSGLAEINTALSDLVAKIGSGTAVDLTAELNTIQGMTTALQSTVATATTDDPGAPVTPSTTPAPTV